jgi:hypothetical protein
MMVWFVPKFAAIFGRMADEGTLPWATTTLLVDQRRHPGIWTVDCAGGESGCRGHCHVYSISGWELEIWINGN